MSKQTKEEMEAQIEVLEREKKAVQILSDLNKFGAIYEQSAKDPEKLEVVKDSVKKLQGKDSVFSDKLLLNLLVQIEKPEIHKTYSNLKDALNIVSGVELLIQVKGTSMVSKLIEINLALMDKLPAFETEDGKKFVYAYKGKVKLMIESILKHDKDSLLDDEKKILNGLLENINKGSVDSKSKTETATDKTDTKKQKAFENIGSKQKQSSPQSNKKLVDFLANATGYFVQNYDGSKLYNIIQELKTVPNIDDVKTQECIKDIEKDINEYNKAVKGDPDNIKVKKIAAICLALTCLLVAHAVLWNTIGKKMLKDVPGFKAMHGINIAADVIIGLASWAISGSVLEPKKKLDETIGYQSRFLYKKVETKLDSLGISLDQSAAQGTRFK